MKARPPVFAISLLSAVALAYELLLMQLFSIVQFHHFASVIIGLALLGYGLGGSFLQGIRPLVASWYPRLFVAACILFAFSLPLSFLVVQGLDFNGEQLWWDALQLGVVALILGLVCLPFSFASLAIGATLLHYRQSISQAYGADLLGAAVGSLLIIFLLWFLMPEQTLGLLVLLALLASLIFCLEAGHKKLLLLPVIAALLAAGWLWLRPFELVPSSYKEISYYLQLPGARLTSVTSSSLAYLQVVENTQVPFRFVPGLSLLNQQEPLPQVAVFNNGGALSAITKMTGGKEQVAYLDMTPAALPYHLLRPQRVLFLGLGGGSDLLLARYHGVKSMRVVEPDRKRVALLAGPYFDYSGGLLGPGVEVSFDDPRGALEGGKERYDLIVCSLVIAPAAAGSGLSSLRENYLYTVQGVQRALARLQDEGLLAVSLWVSNPPRDLAKMLALLAEALTGTDLGVSVQESLAVVSDWQTATLVVKKGRLVSPQIEQLEKFSRERSFTLSYSPVSSSQQPGNPAYQQLLVDLLGEGRRQLQSDYKFNLQPPTDDRPYFSHFLRLSSLPELYQLRSKGGGGLVDVGYLLLCASLVLSALMSLLLLVLPASLSCRHSMLPTGWVVGLFLFLGGGFLLLEISLLKKLILLLHQPLLAAGTVIAAFLCGAGSGSLASRQAESWDERRWLVLAVIFILLWGGGMLLILDWVIAWGAGLVLAARLLLALLLILPIAFAMGIPFPLSLRLLSRYATPQIPLAWAVNGCASVMAAMAASLAAIEFGISRVTWLGLAAYLAALGCYLILASRAKGCQRA